MANDGESASSLCSVPSKSDQKPGSDSSSRQPVVVEEHAEADSQTRAGQAFVVHAARVGPRPLANAREVVAAAFVERAQREIAIGRDDHVPIDVEVVAQPLEAAVLVAVCAGWARR
jgi:hypothetical protein